MARIMKIAVVTASIGMNKLLPQIEYPNVDYHAFVDKQIEDTTLGCWTQHFAIKFSSDRIYENRRNAKIYKIIPFVFLPDYDYFFWIDSNHVLNQNPHELLDTYLKDADVAVFKHAKRKCVYIEGKAIKTGQYDYDHLVDDQLAFYKKMRYPENNGLYALSAWFQRNCETTQKMGWAWWEQICRFSSRDQLSFPFVCHQHKIKLSLFPGEAYKIKGNDIAFPLFYSSHDKIRNNYKWHLI